MSKQIPVRLSCPFCQKKLDATLYRSIWIEYPENRKLVFEDKINVVTCPACKRESQVEFPFLATNSKRHIAVWYEPYPDAQIDKDIEHYARQMGTTSFYATAPRVRDWRAFKEKIIELEQRTVVKPAARLSPEIQEKMQGFIEHIRSSHSQGEPPAEPLAAAAASSPAEGRIADIIRQLRRDGKRVPSSVRDITPFPYDSHDSLVAAVRQGRILVQRFSGHHYSWLFRLLASPRERILSYVYMAVGGVGPIASIVLAIAYSWVWLGGVLLFVVGIRGSKRAYDRAILSSALTSDLAFAFLYYLRQVCLTTPDFRQSTYWSAES